LILLEVKVGTVPAIEIVSPGIGSGIFKEAIQMNGQAKALIPALIGIIILLLVGITGFDMPRVRQATVIAETRAVTLENSRHQALGTAFRIEADAAVRELNADIAAELVMELKHQPAVVVAQNTTTKRDRS
jgi:hypothetical protein